MAVSNEFEDEKTRKNLHSKAGTVVDGDILVITSCIENKHDLILAFFSRLLVENMRPST